MSTEIRSGAGLQTYQGKLNGYAAKFNSPSHDLGGFREIILPGAFKRTLATSEGVRALFDHKSDMVLGRVGAGTLRLEEDDVGLRFELDLPPTTYAKDLAELVKRGDVAGCSFAFRVRPGGEVWEQRNGEDFRILSALDLDEITVTSNPAYGDTTVALRNKPAEVSFWESGDLMWISIA